MTTFKIEIKTSKVYHDENYNPSLSIVYSIDDYELSETPLEYTHEEWEKLLLTEKIGVLFEYGVYRSVLRKFKEKEIVKEVLEEVRRILYELATKGEYIIDIDIDNSE